MFIHYVECEIEVQPRVGDVFPISVRSPGGNVRGSLRSPVNDPLYQELARRLTALDTDEDLVVQIGQLLFHSLFQGQVKEVLMRTQGMLREGQGLRIKLSIAASESEIATIP